MGQRFFSKAVVYSVLCIVVSCLSAKQNHAGIVKRVFHFTNGNKAVFEIEDTGTKDYTLSLLVGGDPKSSKIIKSGKGLSSLEYHEDPENSAAELVGIGVNAWKYPRKFSLIADSSNDKYILYEDGTSSELCHQTFNELNARLLTYGEKKFAVQEFQLNNTYRLLLMRLDDSECIELDRKKEQFITENELNYSIVNGLLSINNVKTFVDLKDFSRFFPIQYGSEQYIIETSNESTKGGLPSETKITRISDLREFKVSEKIIPYPLEAPFTPYILEDGILKISGIDKKVDLFKEGRKDLFAAEIRRFKHLRKADPVLDVQDKPLDVIKTISTLYTDLVEDSRKYPGDYPEKSDPTINKEMASAIRQRRSVVVLGKQGTGKSSAVRAFARDVGQGLVPGMPRTTQIYSISAASLESGAENVGMIEKRVNTLIAAAKELGCIFFIDEIHSISGAGTSRYRPNDVMQMIKGPLERGQMILIGTDTPHEFNNTFWRDAALMDRFEKVTISEPKGALLNEIIHTRMNSEQEVPPIASLVQQAIELSGKYDVTTAQPRAAVNLLRKAYGILGNDHREGEAIQANDLKAAALEKYKFDPALFSLPVLREKLKNLMNGLNDQVIGRPTAKEAMISLWRRKLSEVGDPTQINSIILVGPPGVGKTKIAELSADLMGYKKTIIEMNKYQLPTDVEEFRWKIYSELQEHPFRVFILDEIEKSHPSVQEALLSILQNGEFVVEHSSLSGGGMVSREGNARHSVFVLTSNAGARFVQEEWAEGKPIPDKDLRTILEAERISSTIVSRIQKIIPLLRPTEQEYRQGIKFYLNQTLAREGKKRNVKFILADEENFLNTMAKTYSSQESDFRDIKRIIVDRVEEKIAEILVEKDLVEGQEVIIHWDKNAPIEKQTKHLSYYS